MIKFFLKFSIIIFLIHLSSTFVYARPLIESFHVVRFDPEVSVYIHASEKLELCQGFTVFEKYIVTSDQCITEIKKLIKTHPLNLLNNNSIVIGSINDAETPNDSQIKNYNISLFLEYSQLNIDESNRKVDPLSYAYKSNNDTLTFFNHDKELQVQSVELGKPSKSSNFKDYPLKHSFNAPQGATVLDTYGNIICIISGENHCVSIYSDHFLEKRIKRDVQEDSLDCEINPNFGCSDFELTSCGSDSGSGYCTNTASNQRCSVEFYMKGSHAPKVFFSNYVGLCEKSKGCGYITCENDESSSIECIAHWGWNDETFYVGRVQPAGCMQYHRAIKAGPVAAVAGLTLGPLVFIAGCSVSVFICYWRLLFQNLNAIPNQK